MKTIIAGSRGITDLSIVRQAVIHCPWEITRVVSGTARGVDQLGEAWAADLGIDVDRYPADWKAHGRRAGYLRNEVMAENAGALLAIWDGESRGTKHMIDIAQKRGLKVFVYGVNPSDEGADHD